MPSSGCLSSLNSCERSWSHGIGNLQGQRLPKANPSLVPTNAFAEKYFGGLADLAKQIPIREFLDHGPNAQPGAAADQFLATVYPQLTQRAKHRVVAAGDAPQVLREGVNAGSLPSGRYEVHALLAVRPLSRNEIISASDKDVIARRSARLEVSP